jgi:hypothetical protein
MITRRELLRLAWALALALAAGSGFAGEAVVWTEGATIPWATVDELVPRDGPSLAVEAEHVDAMTEVVLPERSLEELAGGAIGRATVRNGSQVLIFLRVPRLPTGAEFMRSPTLRHPKWWSGPSSTSTAHDRRG